MENNPTAETRIRATPSSSGNGGDNDSPAPPPKRARRDSSETNGARIAEAILVLKDEGYIAAARTTRWEELIQSIEYSLLLCRWTR